MNTAYLLIGGNLGERERHLAEARRQIEEHCGCITRQSAVYQTAAWGLESQAPFLNQALEIKTAFAAGQLLQHLLCIEEKLGRKRAVKYGPRIIDIDILLFNQAIIREEGLTIPHPEMHNRRFALEPLHEIAPNEKHPVFQKSIAQLLEACPDKLDVHKIS